MANIAARLRAYRPSATVLEAEVAPARRGEGAGCMSGPGMTASHGPAGFLEVMRLKRGVHDGTIKACGPLIFSFISIHCVREGVLECSTSDPCCCCVTEVQKAAGEQGSRRCSKPR